MRTYLRNLLLTLLGAGIVAGGFVWLDERRAPSSDVQSGQCLDQGKQVVACESADARYYVIGDGRPGDPNGPCQTYPDATTAIQFNGVGGRVVCVRTP